MKKLIFLISFLFATYLALPVTTEHKNTKHEISQIGKTDHSNINTVSITSEGVQCGSIAKCKNDLKADSYNPSPLDYGATPTDKTVCSLNYLTKKANTENYRPLDFRLCSLFEHSTILYIFRPYLYTPVYLFKGIFS